MSDPIKYPGNELELFQHAKNWKGYFSRKLKRFILGDVLEVGAGIGATTQLLNDGKAKSWVLLEPDEEMGIILRKKIEAAQLPENCSFEPGTIDNLKVKFDCIIYIDVLEHIEKDHNEIKKAAALLNPGGHLIVLSPAFGFLYSPFDKAIGHFRRYNKKMMRKLSPPGLELVQNHYLDSTGYFAAAANKLLLRKKYPSQSQVLFWDRWMIPVSRFTDKLVLHSFGKTIITAWKKN